MIRSPVTGAVPDHEDCFLSSMGAGHIRRIGVGAGDGQVVGGLIDAAAGVDDLELQAVFLRKILDIVARALIVLAPGFDAAEIGQGRRDPRVESNAHGGIKVTGNGRRKGRHGKQDDKQDGGNTVEHPSLPNPLHFCHVFHLLLVLQGPASSSARDKSIA